ncbi:MAG: IclR family transcriptional regulator [Gaiellaceae bacterium MAG52_C11]|nr:IclR family transcriptional regulator [Candidatus Gaiellasilicea maunaloa]
MLDILDVLQAAPTGISMGEIAEAAELPKSSTFRYLATLEARGYVERNGREGQYRLGLAFLPLRARHLDDLAARARPFLEQLRDRFDETINLGVLEGNRIVYLDIVESPRTIRFAARRGDGHPVHSTALGKAIAAHLPDEDVRRILAAEGMPQLTSRTIVDLDAFLEELEQVRRRGFALESGENEKDGCCVAVALTGDRLSAAISLSAPAARFSSDRFEEVAGALIRTGGQLAVEQEPTDA